MGWLENEAQEAVWDLKPFSIFSWFIPKPNRIQF
jgi:hypothetical protein